MDNVFGFVVCFQSISGIPGKLLADLLNSEADQMACYRPCHVSNIIDVYFNNHCLFKVILV